MAGKGPPGIITAKKLLFGHIGDHSPCYGLLKRLYLLAHQGFVISRDCIVILKVIEERVAISYLYPVIIRQGGGIVLNYPIVELRQSCSGAAGGEISFQNTDQHVGLQSGILSPYRGG